MPLFDLNLEVTESDGLASMAPVRGNVWLVQFACGRCGEAAPKASALDFDTVVEVPGSRGTAHLVQGCKNCGSQFHVVMLEDHSLCLHSFA
jgi:hypothetical protein